MPGYARSLRLLLILLAACWLPACLQSVREFAPIEDGVADLSDYDALRDGPLRLDGTWEFFWHRLREDIPGVDDPRSLRSADLGLVPADWTGYTLANNSRPESFGYATYRLKLILPPDQRLAVKFLDAAVAYRLHVNGELLLASGEVGRDAASTVPRFYPQVSREISLTPPGGGRVAIITVEVANYSHRKGGLWESVTLGRARDLERVRNLRVWSDLFIAGSILIMGIYHFGLFALRPADYQAPLFGVFCLVIVTRLMTVGERPLFEIYPDFPWYTGVQLAYLAAFASVPVFFLYCRCLFPAEFQRWPAVVFSTLFGLLCLGVLVLPMVYFTWTLVFWYFLTLFAICWIMVALVIASIRRHDGSLVATAGAIPLFATIVNDSLYAELLVNTGYVLHVGIFIFIFSQAFLLSGRFSRAFTLSEELARNLSASNRQLKSLDRLKDEFLANTSHELRTPLQGIIGIADSLQRGAGGEVPDPVRRQLRLIADSGRRLASLVGDILDFSRLRHRDIRLRLMPVDLHQAAAVVLELSQTGAREKGLQLINAVPKYLPPVLADENRLQQILLNLVNNGIKFTNRGSVTIAAHAVPVGPDSSARAWETQPGARSRAQDAARAIHVSVADTGQGIPLAEQSRIFEPFEQLDVGALREHGGTGLGLPVSRSLLELHGSTLAVDSAPGAGARFHFSLAVADRVPTGQDGGIGANPAAHGQPPETQPLADAPGKESQTATPAASRDRPGTDFQTEPATLPGAEPRPVPRGANRRRILIVDDEPVNLQVISNFVAIHGDEPLTAPNGIDALEILANDSNIDAVILDVMMPYLSGYDVAREIRKKYGLLELPIIIVTARNNNEDLMTGMNAGANDFMVKPVEREALIFRLTNVLNMRDAHRERLRLRQKIHSAIREERQQLNRNLHDHIGAQLVDLKLLADEIEERLTAEPELARKLTAQVDRTNQMLRSQMLWNEDLDLLSEDFFEGLNLILLRRYSSAGRRLRFEADCDSTLLDFEDHPHATGESVRAALYAVTGEIGTNDLKYGIGMAHWVFSESRAPDDESAAPSRELIARFEAETGYRLETHGLGRGTENIARRMAEIGGSVDLSLQEHRIRIVLRVPLS